MRVLVLAGTKFVGRSNVEEALAAGHELTLFDRGRTGPKLEQAPLSVGLTPECEVDLLADWHDEAGK